MISILIGLATTILPSLLGLAERQLDRNWEDLRDDKRMAHKQRLADLNYRRGRNEQLTAIQGQDPRANSFVRWGLSAPVVLTYWFLFAHWWVTGDWYTTDFPPVIGNLFYAVTGFYFLFEGKNVHDSRRERAAILADPEYRKTVEAAGEERRGLFKTRFEGRGTGPKGQS